MKAADDIAIEGIGIKPGLYMGSPTEDELNQIIDPDFTDRVVA